MNPKGEKMKFSIIIPVYNVEQYLRECIDSIMNQTYQDFEVVLVDDGSTDKSGEICDKYVSRNPDKVFVYHKTNQGVLIARDYGIKKSSGDIILFVDSDDCLRKDALQLLYRNFEEYSCDLILFNFSTSPDYHTQGRNYPFVHLEIFEETDKLKIYDLMIMTSKLNNLCTKALKRNILSNLKDYSDLAYVNAGEDLLMSIPIVSNAKRILYIDDVLYYYRQREGSLVHTFNINRAKSIKAVHKELEDYIDIWGMPQYHSKHYTREVRGWIDCLVMLLKNKKVMDVDKYKSALNNLAEDPYFRNAYEKRDKAALSPTSYKVLAYCLYSKRFWIIHRATCLLNMNIKVKCFLFPIKTS